MKKVTDPALLEALNGGKQRVSDPALLAELNGAGSMPESQTSQDARAVMSEFTQHPSRGAFEQLTVPGKIAQSADDIMRLVASGGSMGFADKVAAGGDPERLEAERAMTEAARDRAGWAGTAAELGGAVASPAGLAKQGVTLLGKGAQAIPGIKGLLVRAGLMTAEGAGYGAATAAGNDEDIGTGALTGAAAGGAGSIAGEAVSSGVNKIASLLSKKAPRQTVADLEAAGNAAYKRSEDAGVIIKPEGMQALKQSVIDDFTAHGFAPANEPGAAAAYEALAKAADGNVTLKGLDTIRKTASNGYRPGLRSNNTLVGKVVKRIDELIAKADPEHMAGLDTREGADAMKEAREIWHRARKLETVDKLVERGELNAATSGSGGNVENATRQQIKRLLMDEGKARGFSDEELALAKKAVVGSETQNVLRLAGKQAPSALNVLGHMVSGFATGGATLPLSAATMTGGAVSKKISEALLANNLGKFTDRVARGGPAPSAPDNALQRLAKSKRDTLVRLLMSSGIAAARP